MRQPGRSEKQQFPPQHQEQHPGSSAEMTPQPAYDDPAYLGAGKLKDRVALITGGDSGIGRSVAIDYAREGADVAIVYYSNPDDAEETAEAVRSYGRRQELSSGSWSTHRGADNLD